jgi:putative PIN family toxin of toxin-antitoxin system
MKMATLNISLPVPMATFVRAQCERDDGNVSEYFRSLVRVVLDANVVASGVCWDGEAYLCLVKLARQQAFAFATEATLTEIKEMTVRLVREKRPRHNAAGRLTWYLSRVRLVSPAPLGKQRSRDWKDDPYLAAALAAGAECLVTYDQDLLVLGKPFGIEIVKPNELLRRLHG